MIPGLSGALVNVQTTFGETAVVAGKGRVIDAPVPEATGALPFAVSAQA